MKIIILDQFEFDTTASEEHLTIAVAKSNQYKGISEFFEATKDEGDFFSVDMNLFKYNIKFRDYPYSATVREYLQKFTRHSPTPDAQVIEIQSEWDDHELVLEENGVYIRYHWRTSA